MLSLIRKRQYKRYVRYICRKKTNANKQGKVNMLSAENKIITYRAPTDNFLHAFVLLNIEPIFSVSCTKSKLLIKVVEIISFLQRVKC